MIDQVQTQGYFWKSSAAIFALCLIFGALNMYNGRFEMRDMQVYFDAAGKLLAGESPYGQAFGLSSGFYKYSPAAALVFAPFHLVSWFTARVIFYVLISASIAWHLPRFMARIADQFNRQSAVTTGAIALTTLTLAGHFSRELLLGNVNWLLLVLLLFAFFRMERQPYLSGVLFAFALAFKPHFAVLIPWFLLRQQFAVLIAAASTLLVLFFLPAAGWGMTHNLDLLHEWLDAMRAHNQALADSPNTLYGVPSRWFGIEGRWLVLVTLAIVAVALGVWILMNWYRESLGRLKPRHNLFLEYALILAIIPNLVHTDTEHFMWTFPLIALFFMLLPAIATRWKWLLGAVWLVCVIPYTLATPDLWGADGSRWLEQSGVLGWANVVLSFAALAAHQLSREQ